MRDIIKESCNKPQEIVYDKFETACNYQRCIVKLIKNENGIFVSSNGDKYVPRHFFTMFFARRYFKKLRDHYPEEVKSK